MPSFTSLFDTFYNTACFQPVLQCYPTRPETLNNEVWDRDIPPYPTARAKGWFRIIAWLIKSKKKDKSGTNLAGDTTSEEFVEKAAE